MTNIEIINASSGLLRITFPSGKRKEMSINDLRVQAEEMRKFARTEMDPEMKARLLRNAEGYDNTRTRARELLHAARGY